MNCLKKETTDCSMPETKMNDNQRVIRTGYILFLFITLYLLSCSKRVDFIKLNAPMKSILPQATLTVPEVKATEQGHPVQFVVGIGKKQYQAGIYYGQTWYKNSGGVPHIVNYLVHFSDAVQTDRYIFVPVGYSLGGTGVFYYLTAIDKRNLIGMNSAYIGDRVKIINVKVIDTGSDAVSITYTERNTYPSVNKRVKKLAIEQNLNMLLLLEEK